MTDNQGRESVGRDERAEESADPDQPVIRDKRRLDPETGRVRGTAAPEPEAASAASGAGPTGSSQPDATAGESNGAADASQGANETGDSTTSSVNSPAGAGDSGETSLDGTLADDLRRDLQRLNAEYVNYKRRVDRDRELHKDLAVGGVVEALLPVLDDINLARQHGDLEGGPFAAIAEKLETTLGRYGVVRFGEPGDTFDPNVHEALMHTVAELAPGTTETTIVQVMQPGYTMGERVIRAARVAVADPQD